MPRKTKEEPEKKTKNVAAKKSATTKKTASTKKVAAKKASTTKKSSSTKKTTTTKKTSATKKKNVTKKASTSKKLTAKKSTKIIVTEYYDLPQNYNKTVVKLLAQTPKTLFVYWEISADDIEKFKNQYGDNFFETTRPVLIIHNDTLNYSFEEEINDFANSWYIHVNDSKAIYRIELGRRPIQKNEKLQDDYIYVTTSNGLETPNDHILFNLDSNMALFRNVKTNISFMKNIGKINNIYDEYETEDKDGKKFFNPSSNMSSQFI